jgi:curli biogenesis system outer membrane secretion channel CsgG
VRGQTVSFKLLVFHIVVFSGIFYSHQVSADEGFPIGPKYGGPKCLIAVGDFAVKVRGAPKEIGEGFREMFLTALFESNHFIVVDRLDTPGISAEQLLSDSFLANPHAILHQGQTRPAEVLAYGAVTKLEGAGCGLCFKVPGAPVKVGGAAHKAKFIIELRVVDTAGGRVVSAQTVEGNALSWRARVSTAKWVKDLPLSLGVVRNTPLELAIRDCVLRAVIQLCKSIPRSLFKYGKP